jgi:PIN domain nuclease of toxin-antitoxin system
MATVVYLDNHLLIWLHHQYLHLVSPRVKDLIEEHDCLASPATLLELKFLLEIGRLHVMPHELLANLGKDMRIRVCDKPFQDVIQLALQLDWTRDPFDRIITAQAALDESVLLTKDERIQKNYSHAVW